MKIAWKNVVCGLIISIFLAASFATGSFAGEEQLSREDLEKRAAERIERARKFIEENNLGYTVGLTDAAYMSDAELRRLGYSNILPKDSYKDLPILQKEPMASTVLPAALDWRNYNGFNYVSPVKNQSYPHSCGSCWAFAATAHLESRILIEEKRMTDLSEQQSVDCTNADCDGGYTLDSYLMFLNDGCVNEACYEYTGYDNGSCQDDCRPIARLHSIWQVLLSSYPIAQAKQAILDDGPITTSMCVQESMFYYTGGVIDYYVSECPPDSGHAVLIVGWDDNLYGGVWIIKNSWGSNWGYGGFGYVKYGAARIPSNPYQIDYLRNVRVTSMNREYLQYKILKTNEPYDITWECEYGQPDYVDIMLSDDNGATYDYIVSNYSTSPVGDTYTYSWDVPDTEISEGRVKVIAYYVEGGEAVECGIDVSDKFGTAGEFLYVSSGGADIWPYSKPEWAASNLETVLQYVSQGYSVKFLEGTHSFNDQVDLPDGLILEGGSLNAENTVLQFTETGGVMFYMQELEEGVTFRNLRMVNNLTYFENRAVEMKDCGTDFQASFENCVFEYFSSSSSTKGAAITFESLGDLQVSDCVFRNNGSESDDDAVLYVEGDYNDGDVDLEILECQFFNNYRILNLKRLDTVSIEGCDIYQNTANDKLIEINCYEAGAVEMNGCSIHDNEVDYNEILVFLQCDPLETISVSECLVYGNEAREIFRIETPAEFIDCTFADNDVPLFYQGDCIFCLDDDCDLFSVERCILAFNEQQYLLNQSQASVTSEYNCIYQNGGNYQISGTEISADPLFCDSGNGDYQVSAISPCLNGGSAGEMIGAMGTGCFPAGTTVSMDYLYPDRGQCENCGGPFVFGCPGGDIETFVVIVDFPDDVGRDISASEITLDLLPASAGTFELLNFGDEPLNADSDATSSSSPPYSTTISDVYMCGGGSDIVTVRVNGYPVATCETQVKTPDLNLDETVDLSDYSFLGQSYNKSYGDPAYNENCDYNGDSHVNLSDFSLWAPHYNSCSFDDGGEQLYLASGYTLSSAQIELQVRKGAGDSPEKMEVDLKLTGLDNTKAMCMVLEYADNALVFERFEPEKASPFTLMPVEMAKNGRRHLFIGFFSDDPVMDTEISLGRLVFNTDKLTSGVDENKFNLVSGELVRGDGTVEIVREMGEESGEIPEVFHDCLKNNYPNPFNPSTVIEYSIGSDSRVDLGVYTVTGQLVRTLESGFRKRDTYRVTWDGKDNNGNIMSSGVYFYRLKTDKFCETKKMVLLR